MCPNCQASSKKSVKRGFYRSRTAHKEKIQRYFCKECRRFHSEKSKTIGYKDKKPHLNQALFRLICSGVSQRRAAITLSITRVTVARKLVKLGEIARRQHEEFLKSKTEKISVGIFDELETFEHTKCKPVSVGVMVQDKTRYILGLKAARMPAKGLLVAISLKKYGYRQDERPAAIAEQFTHLRSMFPPSFVFKTDESPRYPTYIRRYLPGAQHEAFKGRRGCVVGQGELKATGRDPLFSLNHTCAMVRDNLKTLTRRTWCTMKCPSRFQSLLDLYTIYHNQMIEGVGRPTLRFAVSATM